MRYIRFLITTHNKIRRRKTWFIDISYDPLSFFELGLGLSLRVPRQIALLLPTVMIIVGQVKKPEVKK